MTAIQRPALLATLQHGVNSMAIELSRPQLEQMIDYLALLTKWNEVYNLTAIRDPLQMVIQHLLDSLVVLPAFASTPHRILDVGAGAGLPGIVLAIARPDLALTLVDAVHKKTAFLTQVKVELGLANVTIETARVEQLTPALGFDVIISRAFANLSDFVAWSGHLLAEGGQFVAMKGIKPLQELTNLPKDWKVTQVLPVAVPGLHAERHLVFIQKARQE